jgi:parvulin-like peptidyl-prolyl isomerase
LIETNAVAMVEVQPITREAFERELMRRAPVPGFRDSEEAEKAAVLEEMIRFEVLHQKALATGYDKDPEIQAEVKRMLVAKFQERYFAKAQHPQVSQEEIADYYRQHPAQFGTEERVRVALIEFKIPRTAPPEKRAEAARKAAAVLAEAKSSPAADGTFGLLAQAHSEDQASRYRGGDIGWLRAGDTNGGWDRSLLAAISGLEKPGEFGPVISTPSAYYVIRLVERQAASMRPLETVKDGVAYLAAREKERKTREEIYGTLAKGLRIHTNQALLQAIRVPATALKPPASPGTASTETRTP